MAVRTRSAYDSAVGFLTRREHSRKELTWKLRTRKYKDDEIKDALDRLEKENLLSDKRFTEVYVRHKWQNGYGPMRIRLELRKCGIGDDLIDTAFKNTDWMKGLMRIAKSRYGDPIPATTGEHIKIKAYLYRRGYDADMIRRFFGKI